MTTPTRPAPNDYSWSSGPVEQFITLVPGAGNHFRVTVSLDTKGEDPEPFDRVLKVSMTRSWLVVSGLGVTASFPRERVVSHIIREYVGAPTYPGGNGDPAR